MRYKIQVNSLWGWSDLKMQDDSKHYIPEAFDLKVDAENEIQDMVESLDDSEEFYRIVPFEQKEEVNFYH